MTASREYGPHGPIDGGFHSPDQREGEPYEGQTMLAFGVTSGSGMVAVEKFLKGGGHVVAVTHRDAPTGDDEEILQPMRTQLVELLDVPEHRAKNNLELAHGHLEDTEEVTTVVEKQVAEGKRINKLLIFRASGIDEFGRPFVDALDGILAIRKDKKGEKEGREKAAIRKINEQLDIILPQTREHAMAVNFLGPIAAIQALRATGQQFEIDDLNSNWGFNGEGPHFYGGPCPEDEHSHGNQETVNGVLTKHLKTLWYDIHGEELRADGILINEHVAPAILGTAVGGTINRKIVPIYMSYNPEAAQMMRDTMIERDDLGSLFEYVWQLDPKARKSMPNPLRTFIMRREGEVVITHHIPEELSFPTKGLPF